MTSSALKRVGSPSTGIRSKRFHLAINGKIATVSSSAVRGRTYASRHVWKTIGGAFFSAGVFLTCAWSQGKLSGCVDTYANAERLSWTHCTHSTRKGFFDIRAPAPSRQHQRLGNVARRTVSSCHRMGCRRDSDIRYGVGAGGAANFRFRLGSRLYTPVSYQSI